MSAACPLLPFESVEVQRPVSDLSGRTSSKLTENYSVLCGAPHKADYVDRTIMWTTRMGKSGMGYVVRVFSD